MDYNLEKNKIFESIMKEGKKEIQFKLGPEYSHKVSDQVQHKKKSLDDSQASTLQKSKMGTEEMQVEPDFYLEGLVPGQVQKKTAHYRNELDLKQENRKLQIEEETDEGSSLFDFDSAVQNMVHEEKARERERKRVRQIALSATKQLNANFEGYMERQKELEELEEFDEKKVLLPDLEKMKESHKVKYRDKVIKRTLKPDKVIREKVVEDKEIRTREKRSMAELVSTDVSMMTDLKVKARTDMDINLKKRMDYHTFSQLSDFSTLMSKEQFINLTTLYGLGMQRERIFKEDDKDIIKIRKLNNEHNIFPALDMMTDVIMKTDPAGFDLSSDSSLARSALELEKMSAAVRSYRELLEKNSEYLTHLRDKGEGYDDIVMKRIEELSAISNYYEIRKLVIEDDLYTSLANEEISMEDQEGDDFKTKNLKKNMRLSYYAGVRLQKVLSGADIIAESFKTKDEGALVLIGKEKWQVADPLDTEEQRSLPYLQHIGEQQKFVERIKHEQLFIAPKEQYNLLTLDPQKMKKMPACGENGAAIFTSSKEGADPIYAAQDAGKVELLNRFRLLGNEKCGSWTASPKFIGGKDEYLSKIKLTDHWNRLDCAFSTEYAYRRTDDEMMEMADLLSVQEDINKWREIKKDPEKMAYYESAFKEMAMKNYEAIYASIVRMSQTIGMHALLLHPVDLMLQANITFKRLLQANAVITNITQKNNPELIKKLFDENNKDGRYICDVDDLVFLGDAFSTINYKLTSNYNMVNSIYRDVVDRYTVEDYFGYDVIDAAEKEQEKLVEELIKEGKTKEADEINKRDEEEMMNWYISMHPELFSEENLLRKDGDGSYVLQNDMVDGIGKMINTGGGIFNQLIKSDKVQKFSEEELRKYENSLKKRKFFTLRWQDAKQFMDEVKKNITDKENNIKKYEKEIKDLKNSQQMDEKQKETIADNEKEILKLQEDLKSDQALLKYYEKFEEKFENDPYALNMFKDGLEELKYKDDKGQEHFIDAQKIFKDLYL